MEEGLKHLRIELRRFVDRIDAEYERVVQELDILESKENEVSEETFSRINDLLQDAWKNAMMARKRLRDLDEDFLKTELLIEKEPAFENA